MAPMPSLKRPASSDAWRHRHVPVWQMHCNLAVLQGREESVAHAVPLNTDELSDALHVAVHDLADVKVRGVLGPESGYLAELKVRMPAERGYHAVYYLRAEIKHAQVKTERAREDGAATASAGAAAAPPRRRTPPRPDPPPAAAEAPGGAEAPPGEAPAAEAAPPGGGG